ncbi:unnamed protein product [Pedinophyceae sp. YPF-701]|nr:unnamed protein product [Pedinophyceae sp. YPF-701]
MHVAPSNQDENAAGVLRAAKEGAAGGGRRPLQDFTNNSLAGDLNRLNVKQPGQKVPAHQYATRHRTSMLRESARPEKPSSQMSWSGMQEHIAEQASVRRPARAEPQLPDIDSVDRNNPLAAVEYVSEIYRYFKRTEAKYMVDHNYMRQQVDINEKMRAILVDWLIEVHLKFKLVPETLYLAVNLIDRFLAHKQVTRKNLQLVGVTAMLIASKYEEIWAPEVRDFVYISDKAYTRDQILQMEKVMLNALKFHLTVPTALCFLTRYLKAAGTTDKQATHLAHYMTELALPDCSMLQFPGSLISACAVYASRVALGAAEPWPAALAAHSGHSPRNDDFDLCTKCLAKLMQKAPTGSLIAVYKKYSSPKFMEVAKLPYPQSILAGLE